MTFRIEFQPGGEVANCDEGHGLLHAARIAGVALACTCGGRTKCGRCRVRVAQGRAGIPTQAEAALLGAAELAAGFRLACAVRVTSDLKVEVPPASLGRLGRVQLAGEVPPVTPDPPLRAYLLSPSAHGTQHPPADWDGLRRELETAYALCDLSHDARALGVAAALFASPDSRLAAVVRDREVIALQAAGKRLLGAAIDIGTTKIAAYLVDMGSGETLGADGMANPQGVYGADVMTRLSHALEHGGTEMQRRVVDGINSLLCGLWEDPDDILEVVVAGNTAMHHLLLGLPVTQLGRAPYVPAVVSAVEVKARDLGIRVNAGAWVHCLPNAAGFVGGDHVAMLLATGLYETGVTAIGIDMGTNTEISLATGGKLTCLSCASGPAFEGDGLKCGMAASAGAIESVHLGEDEVQLEVIGGTAPTGICGSGILDTLGELRRAGLIDERGRLADHPLVRVGRDGKEFVLVRAEQTASGQDIVVTQRDITAVLLAKAAVRAGINILLGDAGLDPEDLDEVVIAGAFGSYVNIESALRLGLLPPIGIDRFRQVGNAAGAGARLALISQSRRALAGEIGRRVRHVQLMTHPRFGHEFANCIRLP